MEKYFQLKLTKKSQNNQKKRTKGIGNRYRIKTLMAILQGETNSQWAARSSHGAIYAFLWHTRLDQPVASDTSLHQFLWFSHTSTNFLPEVISSISPFFRSFHICWRLIVWTWKHWYNAQDYTLHRMDWCPAFTCKLIAIWIITRGVKNWNANLPIRVNIRMPDLWGKSHCWRAVWIILRESHDGIEETPIV